MEERSMFWMNKVYIGKGTLKEFSQEYHKINGSEGQFATASQLFPTGKVVEDETMETGMEYEYLIYYKVNPNALNGIDKATGQVKVDMTEKEGKEMDSDAQTADETDGVVI